MTQSNIQIQIKGIFISFTYSEILKIWIEPAHFLIALTVNIY